MRRFFLSAVLLLLATTSARTQQPALQDVPVFRDVLVNHLAGHWLVRGTIQGKPAVHFIDGEWVMGHQYMRLHEVSRERNPDGTPVYEATIYIGWNDKAKEYGCVWVDTNGGATPESVGMARREGDQLPFEFKAPVDKKNGDKKNGYRTTMSYISATNTWQWEMDSIVDGVVKPFAKLTLMRESATEKSV